MFIRTAIALSLVVTLISCGSAPEKTDGTAIPGHVSINVPEKNIPPSPDPGLPTSVTLPSDGGAPVTTMEKAKTPTTSLTFTKVGQREFVKTGEAVNMMYDGVDSKSTYVKYESAENGYWLELALIKEPTIVEFSYLCQRFIVANPALTSIGFGNGLRYEQIVWTPRQDGSWEVRIGATERGCKSEALDEINKLRTKEYQKEVPKSATPKKKK